MKYKNYIKHSLKTYSEKKKVNIQYKKYKDYIKHV